MAQAKLLIPEPYGFLNPLPLSNTQRRVIVSILNGRTATKEIAKDLDMEVGSIQTMMMEIRRLLKSKGLNLVSVSRYEINKIPVSEE